VQKKTGIRDKRIEREQGDVNTTENRRKYWERNLSDDAKKWFDEDAKYFLHQSLSTPVLNVLSRAQGIYIEDMDGKKYIDMHGNGVHNAGFNNPAVIEAVKKQLRSFLSRTLPRRGCFGRVCFFAAHSPNVLTRDRRTIRADRREDPLRA
jgi:4-aminobutyrate aminotransferase